VNHREGQIFDLLCQHGELSIQSLSEHLGISASSVRRELAELGDHPIIQRTHGGATLTNVVQYNPLPIYKLPLDPSEARAIAALARSLVQPGDVIGLSGGRLCTELALQLRGTEGITVVTNGVNIAAELVALPNLRVMVTGGLLEQNSFELVGQALHQSLEGVYIHKFFVGTDGLSVEHGVSNHSEAEALAARELALHADTTYVLADSTKFRRPHLAQVMPLTEVAAILTTDHTPFEVCTLFRAAGCEVRIAECDA
jgi:DeoR family transcriptional regulator, aga operon transcriptional repressor